MSETAISVEGLSKLYRLGLAEQRHESFLGAALAAAQSPIRNLRKLARLDTSRAAADGSESEDLIWALRDVSFEVQRGEVLGIIGRNGAGKSTLLKILSRVAEPTAGRIVMDDHVSSLLEVGTGFHPELTGRENVYLNGTILGMTKREVARKFDQIVEFSGVGRFLDTPVKRYSSGMKVRLAFAVAAHLEPEILIVDEVLAVGDAEFQSKCLGKMRDVTTAGGRTVLFVSHNMSSMRQLCTRAIWLRDGRLERDGPVDEVIDAYLATQSVSAEGTAHLDRFERHGHRGEDLRLQRCSVLDGDGKPSGILRFGEPFAVEIRAEAVRDFDVVHATLGINAQGGARIVTATSEDLDCFYKCGPAHPFFAQVHLHDLHLNVGEYDVTIALRSGRLILDSLDHCLHFQVIDSPHGDRTLPSRLGGFIRFPAEWQGVGLGTPERSRA